MAAAACADDVVRKGTRLRTFRPVQVGPTIRHTCVSSQGLRHNTMAYAISDGVRFWCRRSVTAEDEVESLLGDAAAQVCVVTEVAKDE